MDNPWWTRAQGEGADAYLDRVVPVLVAQIAELKEEKVIVAIRKRAAEAYLEASLLHLAQVKSTFFGPHSFEPSVRSQMAEILRTIEGKP